MQASLVVNVASHSEQTEANYRSLQELHRELGTSHFNVLAFPCGQFGDTEPGTSRDIEAFAKSTYSVTFPFFSKIKIMGSEADPAFKFLTGWHLFLTGCQREPILSPITMIDGALITA